MNPPERAPGGCSAAAHSTSKRSVLGSKSANATSVPQEVIVTQPSIDSPLLHTSEEKRVSFYTSTEPTRPTTVDPTTPLEHLHLNWTEKQLPERERTKHVHRLHPYLGKYIPQLVEVFLRKFFTPGMTVLDPFAGSGTTLVQAQELGINAIGYDISVFNVLMSKVKTQRYYLPALRREVSDIIDRTEKATDQPSALLWEENSASTSKRSTNNEYLNMWFAPRALDELLAFRDLISEYESEDFLKVVLSRAARSARLTTHFDLDFPKTPTTQPYRCYKHSRICTPTTTAFKFLSRYAADSLRRVAQFAELRTTAHIDCVHANSRDAAIGHVDGVITSPPYVGLIDYHEQHRYAYELLGLEYNGHQEIGCASRGQSKAAQSAYVSSMRDVLANVVSSIALGGPVVLVAADRHDLYPKILDGLPLSHVTTLRRHVNRRTGRRGSEFYESIFIYRRA